MITVREALNLPALASAKVVAGHQGLDRKIEWFHVMDIPQIVPWIKKGDILLSVTYAFQTVPETTQGLVENLNEKGVVGMILAIGLYLKEVPQHMLEAADQLGFPIITISADHHLEEITRQLAEQILINSQIFPQNAAWNQKIMEIVRRSDALCCLTQMAAEVLGSQVVLLDSFGRLLTMGKESGEVLDGLLANFRENHLKKASSQNGLPELGYYQNKHYFYYRLQARDQEIAFLVVLQNIEKADLSRLMLIQNIATIMSVLVSSKEMLQNVIYSAHIPLLENILYGQYASGEITYREASKLGWDLNAEHIVTVFEIENFDKYIVKHQLNEPQITKLRANLIKTMSEKINYIQGKYPVIKQELKFTTIFQLSNKSSLKNIVNSCHDIIDYFNERFNIIVFVGISSTVKDLAGFCTCLNEAKEGIKIIKAVDSTRIAKYDELSMEIILYRIMRDADIKQAYLKKIHKLVDYDLQYNSNLINTLQSYVKNQGNLALTARGLDIHRNTVKYRLKKAEELLDVNLNAPGMFLTLAILLKVKEIIFDKERDRGNSFAS